ncbi:uncharacterized protein LOC143839837 [Paroedura picta]|uniref:uncharacterized protein LOC143839837 n=1 Tax=Paroedura picta TaxID=143630 RepID=UPI0040576418
MSCGKQEGESLRVPLLWRHSWAEQDLLPPTTREAEKCLAQALPKQAITRRASSQSGHAALFETSSTSQPISDVTGLQGFSPCSWQHKLLIFYYVAYCINEST